MKEDKYTINSVHGNITIELDGTINVSQNHKTIYLTPKEAESLAKGLFSFVNKHYPNPPIPKHPFGKIKSPKVNLLPNSYSLWTEEEEAKLKTLKASGVSNEEIARQLGRKAGGIRSRLKKLKLI